MINQIIEELKELIGNEFTLLEMDNTIQGIVGTDRCSIFEGETEGYIERGEYSYIVWEDKEETETRDINIHFETLEDNEDIFEVIIKVMDVELL